MLSGKHQPDWIVLQVQRFSISGPLLPGKTPHQVRTRRRKFIVLSFLTYRPPICWIAHTKWSLTVPRWFPCKRSLLPSWMSPWFNSPDTSTPLWPAWLTLQISKFLHSWNLMGGCLYQIFANVYTFVHVSLISGCFLCRLTDLFREVTDLFDNVPQLKDLNATFILDLMLQGLLQQKDSVLIIS